ncbi:SDR family NAD(P)-dependent oxidoreductase [Nocardia sp. BMG111209]|uniref:SDR family NAD(P)-dependent oxidoreductase n=1 Tax=Nocardia sp. BMG111209 TaxID=1160137 RepID=UPI00036FCA62|nr:SDR family oxidoreductase [Nocardia sp. BMG111209]
MTGRLTGKVALITGTAGGQGRAAALLFAAEGATVVGTDVNATGAAETVDLVRAAGGRMTSAHPLDLADEAGVRRWVDEAATAHGGIDILYNNAGATRFAPLTETGYDDWSFTLRNELDIVFLVTKYAWPHLISRGGGAVLLVGSTAGITGSMTNARIAHTAAKGGVVAMTKQLAAEGAPHGIRVNCVSPGMIRTPATEHDLLGADHPMRDIATHIPLGRVGGPEEIARCALFLLGDDSSYVTGANLVADGGWSAVLPGAW